MNARNRHLIASIVFLFAGTLHLLRIALQWDLLINGWLAPVWLSAVAVVLTYWLAWTGFTSR
jgi:hypothetical protein